jgi:glycosyltransferase involved in cell wall biosynthesis
LTTDLIIPVLNEEKGLRSLIPEIPSELVRKIIVVDNGSKDNSPSLARSLGAIVIEEKNKGYGAACAKGVEYLRFDPPETVAFMDGDRSDFPEDLYLILEPIKKRGYDFVLGSRILGQREKNALMPHAKLGNTFICLLIWFFFGFKYTDLGPLRAIRFSKLLELNIKDRGLGWTVEMQIKAIQHRLKILEVPVRYRKRIGRSKISGTLLGSARAGFQILKKIAELK